MIIIEHKTASGDITPGSLYWAKLLLDVQVSAYLLAIPAEKVLYDVLRKLDIEPRKATPPEKRKYTTEKSKACPVCKQKNAPPPPHTIVTSKETEGPDCVQAKCSGGRIVTDPGGQLYAGQTTEDETPAEYFARCVEEIASNPERYFQRIPIVRLAAELEAARDDLRATAEEIERSSWPRSTDACVSYGKLCDYWPVCSGSASIEDEQRYQHVPKEPTRLPMLSVSSAKTFRACPRKYYFANVLRRRPIEREGALSFGTLIHKALEVWHTKGIEAALATVPDDIDPFVTMRARAMVIGYDARWLGDALEVVAVEQEFEIELISQRWLLGGRVDGIAKGES